jgi:putative transposase
MEKLTSLEKYRIIEPILQNRAAISAVAKYHDIPLRTLQHWKTVFQRDGISALERKKRTDENKHRIFPDSIIALVKAFALQKPPMSVSNIHKRIKTICQKDAIPFPSYNWVYQQSKAIAPDLLTLAQKGSKAYKQQFELLFRHDSKTSNAIWQADHTLLDIWVLNEKKEMVRPWLSIILDDFSRVITGYYLSENTPDATHTALALRQAIWKKNRQGWSVCGIPQKLYTDNGGDFISEHILQVCLKLKIELIHSLPANPRGRGKIERFFLTVNEGLLQTLDGYSVGGKPSSPPTLSIKELEAHLSDFIIDNYNHQATGKDKMSPFQRWQGDGSFLPQMPSSLEDLDDLMMHIDKARRIQRDGIHFMNLRYGSITLVAFVGEQVTIRYDPRDLAEIKVYFTDGTFLCKAVCQDIADLTISLRELLSARKAVKKALDDQVKDAKQLLRSLIVPPTQKTTDISEPIQKNKSTLKLYAND